ncbi:MAG: response regulator [Proteobacteria bacterium]|nr:response regulator [Pseudomonadota bacterium]
MTKILVVEDEAIIAEAIRVRLEKLNYEVVGTVTSGEEALQMIRKHEPDLVLMDILLDGELDGIDTAMQIHNQFGTPLIYLTSYSSNSHLERAKKTYPKGYILKPFKNKELHAVIEMSLHPAE